MISITNKEIIDLPKIKRLNIINSITGVKPGNLIGTVNEVQITNLAVFSSIVHLGSNPALLGFILRPAGKIKRHTYENIIQKKFFSINHINEDMIDKAHLTSLKFPSLPICSSIKLLIVY